MGTSTNEQFLLIGLSHKTAPIVVREKFSLAADAIPPFLDRLARDDAARISEAVLLSTCNRTELYALVDGPVVDARARILDIILDHTGASSEFGSYFYTMDGAAVIEHLFRVASGIDSMILGEPQIFGQVKNAYSIAYDYNHTGPATNRLFHHAFQVGKQVRSATSIGEGIVSISSAAVALAQNALGSVNGASVLLVGAGKIGELCARQLVESGIAGFTITNRTLERAVDLASRLSGTASPFENLGSLVADADIVLASVACSDPVITGGMVDSALAGRGGRPLVLIDLGVPRNVVSDAGCRPGVHLFNIDDLEGVVVDNRGRRAGEAEKANEIIAREVEVYMTWLGEREVAPVIHELRARCEDIRLAELERVKNRVDGVTFQTLDLVTRRILRKFLHGPTVTVRTTASGESRRLLVETIRGLFMDGEEPSSPPRESGECS